MQQQQAPSSPARPASANAGAGARDAGSPGGMSSCSQSPEGGDASPSLADRSPSREAMEQLGRDNFYYKQSNKELRRKLRAAGSSQDATRQQLEEALAKAAHDERVQARLQDELANLRQYIASHPGATPTRVTKAALREITPDVATSKAQQQQQQPPRQAWPTTNGMVTPR